jgi:poly(3-hydroxybutyrate) depolymerase
MLDSNVIAESGENGRNPEPIIVLYPQAHATSLAELPSSLWLTGMANINPNGCWNWWGYGGDGQYLTKKGVQISAIWKMVERLEGK